ncbi:MAG: hypothetical protein IID40_02465 [Planctomycetes bacterium]|nr:hypothetical protein [Planctomycetota bacterium]
MFLAAGACSDNDESPVDDSLEPDAAPVAMEPPPQRRVFGLNFSPFVSEGQDPNQGAQVSASQIAELIEIIAPHTQWIRTYGSQNGLEEVGRIAKVHGLKTAIGAWIGPDSEANDREIAGLIDAAREGNVDVAIVGNEVLLRGQPSPDQLLGYMGQVREALAGTGIPVTTVDNYEQLLAHPEIMAASDTRAPTGASSD